MSDSQENKYPCCESCHRSLFSINKGSPPKFSIVNGFAIGHLPEEFDDIDDILASMISPVRPFAYMLTFQGGQGKKLKGPFTFFDNNIKQSEGVISDIQKKIPNNVLYCVLCGRFTPDQRQLARQRARVNTEEFMRLYNWMRENNIAFADKTENPQCPRPVIIEEKNTKYKDDSPLNSAIEQTCEFKYYFPSNTEPTKEGGTYEDEAAFATALLEGTQPTLLFHPGRYCKEHTISFTDIFPVQFPFGYDDIFIERSPSVSKLECIKHYCKLSLPRFRRQDFLLVSVHMYHRILLFDTGMIKCKTAFDKEHCLAEKVSKLTTEEVKKAVLMHKLGKPCDYKDGAQYFLKAVETSCRPLGHSNEAADYALKKYMSLWNHFGPPSIFFTVSPCDEVSFRMKLYATADSHKLPSLDWTDEECLADWTLRSKLRGKFPGAGAIEFQNFLHILLEDCLGWDVKRNKFKCNGMFGKIIAFGSTVEEQDIFTLHIHLLLWIMNFNEVRDNMFSENLEEREEARAAIVDYCFKIMTASYPDLELTHTKSSEGNDVCMGNIIPGTDQEIRNLRDKNKCYEANGVVAKCYTCDQIFTTVEMVNNEYMESRDSR